MKKINRFLMIYMVVITVLCICMCYLAFSANEKKDNLKDCLLYTSDAADD